MATLGTEESKHCGEVAIVETLKQERMYILSTKKGCCREVAVIGGSTVMKNDCFINIFLLKYTCNLGTDG